MSIASLKDTLPQLAIGNINLQLLKLDGIEYRTLNYSQGESYSGGWKNSKVRRIHFLLLAQTIHSLPSPSLSPSTALSLYFSHTYSLKEKGLTLGMTAAATQEHGTVALNTAGAPIPGLMAPRMKENGSRGTCMGMALSKPQKVLDTLVAGLTTKKMALVPKYTLMGMFMKVYGVLAKQMDQEGTFGRNNKHLPPPLTAVEEEQQLEMSTTENGGRVECMDKAP